MQEKTPLIMGHRGSREHYLENTLKSFMALKETPAYAVEFDVHYTKDNHWIVHHDDSFERLTNSNKLISQSTLIEIENISHHDGQKIPLLNEVLDVFKNTNFKMQIEIKSLGNFEKLIATCKEHARIENIVFISFNHKILIKLKEIDDKIKTACLMYALPVNPIEIINACKADGISLNVKLIDEELIHHCHEHQYIVTAWNVNDKKTYEEMKKLNIDIIGTDKTIEIYKWMEK